MIEFEERIVKVVGFNGCDWANNIMPWVKEYAVKSCDRGCIGFKFTEIEIPKTNQSMEQIISNIDYFFAISELSNETEKNFLCVLGKKLKEKNLVTVGVFPEDAYFEKLDESFNTSILLPESGVGLEREEVLAEYAMKSVQSIMSPFETASNMFEYFIIERALVNKAKSHITIIESFGESEDKRISDIKIAIENMTLTNFKSILICIEGTETLRLTEQLNISNCIIEHAYVDDEADMWHLHLRNHERKTGIAVTLITSEALNTSVPLDNNSCEGFKMKHLSDIDDKYDKVITITAFLQRKK